MSVNAIRARYSRHSLTVYQAYRPDIAEAAVRAGRFVAPFNMHRMTWIKPSFLWLMARSNWARKSGQERVLAIDIAIDGWLSALGEGVLTSYHPEVHGSYRRWERAFHQARVHVQWDPERDIRGRILANNSIQVGIGRAVIGEYVESWILAIRDITPLVRKIHGLVTSGRVADARRHLPRERPYLPPDDVRQRLAMA